MENQKSNRFRHTFKHGMPCVCRTFDAEEADYFFVSPAVTCLMHPIYSWADTPYWHGPISESSGWRCFNQTGSFLQHLVHGVYDTRVSDSPVMREYTNKASVNHQVCKCKSRCSDIPRSEDRPLTTQGLISGRKPLSCFLLQHGSKT